MTAEINAVRGLVSQAGILALVAGNNSTAAAANLVLMQAEADAAKIAKRVTTVPDGTYYLPATYIDVDGNIDWFIRSIGGTTFDRIVTNSVVPYISNVPNAVETTASTLGFGKFRITNVRFNGHWNRNATYLTSYNSDTCVCGQAIMLRGIDNAQTDEAWITDCSFVGIKQAPTLVRNAKFHEFARNYCERTLDPGMVRVANVQCYGNRIRYSGDNGISLSRGCGNVHCYDNDVFGSNSAFWLSKYTTGGDTNALAARRLQIHNNNVELSWNGVHLDGAPKSIDCHNNHMRWIGFNTTVDNEVGFGSGTHLDTTIAADAAVGATTITLTDASKLTAGEYFVVHPTYDSSSRVYYAVSIASNVVTIPSTGPFGPVDEALLAARVVRVTKAFAPLAGTTGYGIYIQGTTAPLWVENGQVHHNTIRGWTGKAAIAVDRARQLRVVSNAIEKPFGLVSAGGVVYGVLATDGSGGPTAQNQRLVIDDNDIDMTGLLPSVTKEGVTYTHAGGIDRGGPCAPKGNRIKGVLIGKETTIPTPTYATPTIDFFDEWGTKRTTPEVDALLTPASISSGAALLGLFDFGRGSGLNVGSTLATAQAVADTAATLNTAQIILTGTGTATHSVDGKYIEFSASHSTTDRAYLDLFTDLNINAGTGRSYLIIVWVQMVELANTTGYSTAAGAITGFTYASGDEGNAFLALSDATPTRSLQMRAFDGANNIAYSMWWDNAGQTGITAGGSTVKNTWHQYAISYDLTTTGGSAVSRAFIDGGAATVHTRADVVQTTIASGSVKIGCGAAGVAGSPQGTVRPTVRLARAVLINIAGFAGDTAAATLALVAADYAANNKRFV